MQNFPLPRIDKDEELRNLLLPYCRIKEGSIWKDPKGVHKVACVDAADPSAVKKLLGKEKAVLAVQDPPYNFVAFKEVNLEKFIEWCRKWIDNTFNFLSENSSLYIWLGADQTNHFEPFAEFIQMMKSSGFQSRSFITMRNQRGYGTQKNWMSVRQELLYYVKGKPYFDINSEYTEIPKILKGYYKKVNGRITDNFGRSKSKNIRAGNVWIDIQQVFYRMEENINGCYAQKPVRAIDRIIRSAAKKGELVIDFFSHSGTTLLSSEMNGMRCYTSDLDPVFCEITLRRLENFRKNKKTGWQNSNPFTEEIIKDKRLRNYLNRKMQIDELSVQMNNK